MKLLVSQAILSAMATSEIPIPIDPPTDAVVGEWFPFIIPAATFPATGLTVDLKATASFGSRAVIDKLLGGTYPGTTPELWGVFTDVVIEVQFAAADRLTPEDILNGTALWTLESRRGGVLRTFDVGAGVRGVANGAEVAGSVAATGALGEISFDRRAVANPAPLQSGLAVNFKSDSLMLRSSAAGGLADITRGILWAYGVIGKNPDYVMGQAPAGCDDPSTDEAVANAKPIILRRRNRTS